MEAVSEGLERLGEAPQSAHRGAGAQAALSWLSTSACTAPRSASSPKA